MKCLVLGGGGFLGSHLCRALGEEKHSVRVFERYAAPPANSLEWVQGDFAQAQQVSAALAGCEVVYHLISTTIPRSSNDDPVFDVQSNVIGTLRMLEQAAKAGVRKIVFVSSGGTV